MIGLGLGLTISRRAISSSSEDAATTAWAAACTTPPTAGRRTLMNTLISGMKTDGTWTLLDWLCIVAAEDNQAARVNIKDPSKSATAVNSPTFTVDRGYAGDGATSYISTEVLNTAGNQYSLNSASFFYWCNTEGTSTTISCGAASGSLGNIGLSGRISGGTELVRINDATSENIAAGGTKTGFRCMSRTASNVKRAFLGTTRTLDVTTASVAISTSAGSFGRNGGTYTDPRIALLGHGAGISDAQEALLQGRFSTFLTAIGAN